MAKSKKRAGQKAGAWQTKSVRRRSSRRRRSSSGLAGFSKPKDAKNDILDIALMAAGTFAATKGVGMLDRIINKSDSKLMSMAAPALVTAVGVAGATLSSNRMVKSVAKGIATGGGFKLAEKALNKPGLLSGAENRPLMLPGIGEYEQAELKELSQYSENLNADAIYNSGDPQYNMGTQTELLGYNDDLIAC